MYCGGYPVYPVYQNNGCGNNDGFGNSWWSIFIVIIIIFFLFFYGNGNNGINR